MQEVFRTSSKSVPKTVAGAIAGVMREGKSVEVQAVGAGAINQAVKAIAIARGFLAPSGINIVCSPTFTEIEIEKEIKTAVKLLVEQR